MIFKSTGYSSMLLTALISYCRFINVKFPFHKISTKLILSLYSIVQLALMVVSYEITVGFKDAPERIRQNKVFFFLYCQLVYSHSEPGYSQLLIIPVAAIPAVVAFIGVFLSGLTIYSLRVQNSHTRNDRSERALRRGSLAIAIMNLGNLVMAVFCVLYQIYQATYPVINFLGASGVYIILSGLNPLVRVCCSTEIQDMIRNRGKQVNTGSTWAGVTVRNMSDRKV